MRRLMVSAAVAASLALACSSDETTGQDVVESVDGRSAVDALIALVSLRTEDGAGYLDHRHLLRMRLRVDGRLWGTYELHPEPFEEGSGWVVGNTRSEALAITELGAELERTEDPLDTVAEWRALLEMHLAPGGHVLEIERIWLDGGGGTEIELSPRLFVPFEIAQGDATAYVGEITIDVELGGAS